jgi:hypothetical protein
MADDDRHDSDGPDEPGPSLELPSLRAAFRRRARNVESEPDGPEIPPLDASGSEPGSAEPPVEPRRRRERRPIRFRLPGPVAALLTGVVVGLVLVGLTSASLGLCTSLRGTSSCGKPGILVLLAITLVGILVGSLLLRLLGVGTHGSTSFLGIGLLVVLLLLALVPMLDEWWAVVVVPALAMLTYLASWWLTTTYVEPGERAR